MIFEYALEPELVATWHDPHDTRYFKEKFGVGRGRLVSRYPSRWQALVWKAFQSPDQNAKKRLEGLLKVLTNRMIVRGSSYDGTQSWLENAEEEHLRRNFHLILARTNPRHHPAVVVGAEIDEDAEPRWAVRSSLPVGRHPEQLARAVAPMLRCCSEVVFVDPHFKPDEIRYRRTLGAFLVAIIHDRIGALPSRIELQVNSEILGQPYFAKECNAKLPSVIPAGLTLRILRWKQRPGSQELHNRYILTDIGGVSFGHGLDEARESRAPSTDGCAATGPTDDIKLFDLQGYQTRWDQYASDTPAFDIDGEPLSIVGKGRS